MVHSWVSRNGGGEESGGMCTCRTIAEEAGEGVRWLRGYSNDGPLNLHFMTR